MCECVYVYVCMYLYALHAHRVYLMYPCMTSAAAAASVLRCAAGGLVPLLLLLLLLICYAHPLLLTVFCTYALIQMCMYPGVQSVKQEKKPDRKDSQASEGFKRDEHVLTYDDGSMFVILYIAQIRMYRERNTLLFSIFDHPSAGPGLGKKREDSGKEERDC